MSRNTDFIILYGIHNVKIDIIIWCYVSDGVENIVFFEYYNKKGGLGRLSFLVFFLYWALLLGGTYLDVGVAGHIGLVTASVDIAGYGGTLYGLAHSYCQRVSS